MSAIKTLITGVVSILVQFGLAIAAWGGWRAFFQHAAFRVLAGVTIVLTVLAAFSRAGFSSGEKEDRHNRWVLGGLHRDCAPDGFLLGVHRSYWVLDAGRRRHPLGGSCPVFAGRAAAHCSCVCVEESL